MTERKPPAKAQAVNGAELWIGRSGRPGGQAQAVAGCYAYDRAIAATTSGPLVDTAAKVLEAVVLQLLRRTPAQVMLYEAQATTHFAEIKHLMAATQRVLGQQWLTAREACAGLAALNERMMARASLLAAARLPNWNTYNAQRRAPEPWQYVVLSGLDALVLQDPAVLTMVQHLAHQGPRCGVVLVLLHNLDAARASPLQAQQRKALYAALGTVVPQAFGFDFSGGQPMPYHLGEPYQRFVADFGYVPDIREHELRVEVDAILSARQTRADKSPQQDFLSVKVGESLTTPAYFAMGHASHAFNALISGGSGSGKTTFVQNLVLSVCEQYTPAQIQLVLLDYGTVSFGPYEGVEHVLTIFNTPQDGQRLAQLFAALKDELHRRKDAFKACGEQYNLTVDNMTTYSRISGDSMPSWLIVIDEFGSLMSNDNSISAVVDGRAIRVSALAEQVINLLVREGRKVGMHWVLITQSFAKMDRMPQDVKSNPHLAVGLKAEEARDSYALLSSENDGAKRIAPYQAVMNRHSGEPKHNVVVDLDYVSEAAIAQRQAELRQRWPRAAKSALAARLDGGNVGEASGETSRNANDLSTGVADTPDWLRAAPSLQQGKSG